jgi:hypothetical protein
MEMKNRLALALSTSICLSFAGLGIQASYAAQATAEVPLVADGLSGVVTSAKGPEAGVWVIAETADLPTRYIKVVVTDDMGRYVLPELPKANYKVFVRGYGLIDSKPVQSAPGKKLNLTAVVAPTPQAAAEYYPPNYWFSLLKVPAETEFPGTGPQGNGIPPEIKNQQVYMAVMKEGCVQCHSVGTKITRQTDIHTTEAWLSRIQKTRPPEDHVLGNNGNFGARGMLGTVTRLGMNRSLTMFADWGKSIAEGTVPPAPPRPTGVERNVVLTEWDWAEGRFNHDIAMTDRRKPTSLANTPIYGSGVFTGTIPWLDPVKNTQGEILIPGANGKEHDLDAYPHTVMIDPKGRSWQGGGRLPAAVAKHPDSCTDPANPYAKYFPVTGPGGFGEQGPSSGPRKTGTMIMYDPAEKKVHQPAVCFQSHHLHFGRDTDDTLFFSGDENIIGWVNTKKYDETKGDIAKSTGWCPMVLDTNGDGKITANYKEWNEPKGAVTTVSDPKKDTRIMGFLYGVEANPVDNSIWFAKYRPGVPGGIVRFDRGANPPETCKSEYYEPPMLPDGTYGAAAPRGISVDGKGIVWVAFSTGQMGRFDRTKCKVMNGPSAAGQQCADGWTFYDSPGPKFANVKKGGPDFHYVVWADLYDTLGLGKDAIILPGTNSDSVHAMLPGTEKFVTLRVPYPLGFYTRNVEGRIDDEKAGWKGRGLWGSFSHVPVWHQEGGDEALGPGLVKFQVRPDPLAF